MEQGAKCIRASVFGYAKNFKGNTLISKYVQSRKDYQVISRDVYWLPCHRVIVRKLVWQTITTAQ